jgi:predicted ATPase
MRLTKIIVENFRGYRERTEIGIGTLTSIIGKNDVGKSTIMEALAIFFECDDIKIESSDVNVHRRDDECRISCVFEGPFNPLVIDASAETTLADEFLLNADGFLEVVKSWDCRATSAKPKCSVYVRAFHPSADGVGDLLSLTNSKLKTTAKAVGVDLKSADVKQTSNVSLRKAIRLAVGDLNLQERDVPLTGGSGKEVWDVLQKRLPAFALFRSDRPSRDDDPEAADPMKVAVQEALASVEAEIEEVRRQVRDRVVEVARRTMDKVREMDPELAQQLNPTFKSEPKFDGFKMALTGEEDIPINKRGSGVRRLILLNFFRAEAERRRELGEHPSIIYAIEEPETSLHPDKQRMLIGALRELSEAPETQVLLTTHAPGLASLLPKDSIRFVNRREDGHPIVDFGEEVLENVANALGVMPDIRRRPNVIVYVEGPNDIKFLKHICSMLREYHPHLVCISTDPRVAFVMAGGSTLQDWIEQRFLKGFDCSEVHIYDRDDKDKPTYQSAVDLVQSRPRTFATLTNKRAMENYLHEDAVKVAFDVPIKIEDWSDVPGDVHRALQEQSKQATTKKQIPNKRNIKRTLNDKVASAMTLEMLSDRDPDEEVYGWLFKIKDFANQTE